MARTLVLVAALAGACAPSTGAPAPITIPMTTNNTTTTTSTTTTAPPPPPPPPTLPDPPEGNEGASMQTDTFWRELADCECASGSCDGPHISYFQFSEDTAAKVGIDGSEPYEEQRAAAIEWARRIHPRENTPAGWPTCWDRAS